MERPDPLPGTPVAVSGFAERAGCDDFCLASEIPVGVGRRGTIKNKTARGVNPGRLVRWASPPGAHRAVSVPEPEIAVSYW